MNLCKVSDIFIVKYGVNLELVKLEQVDSGVSFVSRTALNNGVVARVARIPYIKPIPAGTISVACGGSVMEAFLQPEEYYSGRDLFFLTPKEDMPDSMKLYYCMCLRHNKFKYSYGRQANKTLGDLLVPSPDSLPGFLNTFSLKRHLAEILKRTRPEMLDEKSAYPHTQGLVRLEELFEVCNGIASSEVMRSPVRHNSNWIPYMRPSHRQASGIDAYVNRYLVDGKYIHPAGTLYVSTDGQGSHSYAYVSTEEFVPNSNVAVLLPRREMTLREKLFYALCITHNRFKFSYGRKPKGERLKSIMLPAAISRAFNELDLKAVVNSLRE